MNRIDRCSGDVLIASAREATGGDGSRGGVPRHALPGESEGGRRVADSDQ